MNFLYFNNCSMKHIYDNHYGVITFMEDLTKPSKVAINMIGNTNNTVYL